MRKINASKKTLNETSGSNYSVANCKIFLVYRNSESKTSLLTGVQVPNWVKELLDDPLNRGLILCGTCVKMK